MSIRGPAAIAERVAEPRPADLLALPAEWLAQLRQAADEVDTEMAGAAIERIRERDPRWPPLWPI